jgi:carbohydrate esterase-like sialic acid-specific acetylesterase
MIKYLIIILFLFSSVVVKAQTQPSGFPTQANTGWTQWGYQQSTLGTIIAKRDTTFLPRFNGTIVFRPQNIRPYFYDSTALRWFKLFSEPDTLTTLATRYDLTQINFTNSNIGSGYRWAVPNTNNIKTVFASNTILWDSTSNSNALTAKADTSVLATQYDLTLVGGNPNLANVFLDSNYAILLLYGGESNGTGVGDNTCASAGELDSDPKIQIMQPTGVFEALNIGAGNNLSGPPSGLHGWELELQNLIATQFSNRTVYLVKAAKGGSAISQWAFGSANWDTLNARMDNALARLNELGKIPVICMWYSQGINDAVLGTNETVWATATLELFNNLRMKYGFFPIIMTQLIGDRITYPKLDLIDAEILAMASDKNNYIYRVLTPQTVIGSSCADSIESGGIHWQYLGIKAVADRMANAMLDTAGYIYYHEGTKNISENAWRIGGNRYTNITDNFIGTIDNTALLIKTNNIEAIRIGTNQRVGIGVTSPTKILDVNGDALINGLTVGRGSGNDVTNVVLGNTALSNNTSGTHNVALGYFALRSNTTAFGNIGIGSTALQDNTTACCNVAIGFQAGINSTGSGNVFLGTQAGGSGSYTSKFFLSNLASVNLLYGDFSNGHLVVNPGSSPSDDGVGTVQVRGKITVTTHTIASNSDSALIWDRSTNEYKYARINGITATTLYTGDGTLAGNRTISGVDFSLTADNINNFRINANAHIFSKNDATIPYSGAIVGSGNIYEFGYTPTAAIFTKGAGLFIDTNNNVGLAITIPTTIPLYATGNSAYVQGFQSNAGNFYRVDNITSDANLTVTEYFITVDATGGNITLTLPAASSVFGSSMGIQYVIKRLDASGNTVTVQRNGTPGTDTIDGATSFTIVGQYTVKEVQCISTSTFAIK